MTSAGTATSGGDSRETKNPTETGAIWDSCPSSDSTKRDSAVHDTSSMSDTGMDGDCPVFTGSCGRLDWIAWLHSRAVDSVNDLAVMPHGTLVIGGEAMRELVFGEGQPNETTVEPFCGGQDSPFLALYQTDGTLLWAKRVADGCDVMRLQTLATESNRIVAGGLYFGPGTTFGVGTPAETTLPDPSFVDVFVATYTDLGDLVWATAIRGYGVGEQIHDVDLLVADDVVYVTGDFYESVTFAPNTAKQVTLTARTYFPEFYGAAYRLSTGEFLWARRGHVPEPRLPQVVSGRAIRATDGQAQFGVGIKDVVRFDDGLGSFVDLHATDKTVSAGVVTYSSSGTLVSANLHGGSYATAIMDAGNGGEVHALSTGSAGSDFTDAYGQPIHLAPAAYHLAWYDATGALQWAAGPDGPTGGWPHGVDVRGDQVVVGGSFGGLFADNELTYACEGIHHPWSGPDGAQEGFVARHGPGGRIECVWSMIGSDTDFVSAVAFDHEGGILVTGVFEDDLTLFPGTTDEVKLTAGYSTPDAFLLRIAP